MQKTILAVVVSGAWIGASEFLRNELLFKPHWLSHYQNLGLTFPSTMINNAVWGVWSFVMAGLVYVLTRSFSFWKTAVFAWLSYFVMMWLVIGNLNVLPFSLLWIAVPWSMIEIAGTVFLCRRLDPV